MTRPIDHFEVGKWYACVRSQSLCANAFGVGVPRLCTRAEYHDYEFLGVFNTGNTKTWNLLPT